MRIRKLDIGERFELPKFRIGDIVRIDGNDDLTFRVERISLELGGHYYKLGKMRTEFAECQLEKVV